MKIINFLSICILTLLLVPIVSIAQSTPLRIDMIVTANTSVPPFYSGKPQPSSGGKVTVTTVLSRGTTLTPSNYFYTWTLNGKVQNAGKPTRNNVLDIQTTFESEIRVSVAITDNAGTSLGTKTHVIPIAKPELYFYEINPLRGLTFTQIPKSITLTEEEITVRALAYFIDATIPQNHFFTTWTVNNKTIIGSDPFQITLQKKEAGEIANTMFKIGNTSELLQNANGSFVVTFK